MDLAFIWHPKLDELFIQEAVVFLLISKVINCSVISAVYYMSNTYVMGFI